MKINVSGPLEIEDFPVDQPFAFEVHADAFVLKAGAKPFLIVRRETGVPAQVSTEKSAKSAPVTSQAIGPAWSDTHTPRTQTPPEQTDLQRMHAVINRPKFEPTTGAVTADGNLVGAQETVTRIPATLMHPASSLMHLDVARANKYRTNRRKWFDAIASLNGRPITDLDRFAQINSLEGDCAKMVQFFMDEGALKLQLVEGPEPDLVQMSTEQFEKIKSESLARAQQTAQASAAPSQAIQGGPGAFMSGADAAAMFGQAFGQSQGAPQGLQGGPVNPTQVSAAPPGPLWAPPAGPGNTTNGPKFP